MPEMPSDPRRVFRSNRRLVVLLTLGLGALCFATTAAAQTPEVAATISGQSAGSAGPQTEGPTEGPDGSIYFTSGNQILRLGSDGQLSIFRDPANRPNGLVFDREFRLIAAETGDMAAKIPPRITRTDLKTGRVEVLTAGMEIGTPNDVTLDGQGRIYFTAAAGVHRIDADGKVTRILAPLPIAGNIFNGIMVSPDDRTLYVSETGRNADSRRRLQAYDLHADGSASNVRLFKDFYPGRGADGFSVDVEGNLYVAAGLNRPRQGDETLDVKGGIYIYSPKGDLIQHIPISVDDVRNCTFGGKDLKTLYVTAGNTLFRIRNMKIAGMRR